MTRKQLKYLIKEEIRFQLTHHSDDILDEGVLDRMKAKAKGAVSGIKGAVGAVKDKAMGKGEKGQSMNDAMKQGASGGKQKAVAKQLTGTYLKKVGKQLGEVQSDFTKLLGMKAKDFNEFVFELSKIDSDAANMIDRIYKVSESLKQKMAK